MRPEEILLLRERYLGRALSLSYREPLKIVRGWKQYLFDEQGLPVRAPWLENRTG